MPADRSLVAIVTGGTRGIGAAVADLLEAEGHRVTVAARTLRSADPHERSPRSRLQCDVTVEADVVDLFRGVIERHGRVDVVVNCAGGAADAMLHKMSVQTFREAIDVNLFGTWLCTREALRHMRGRPGGGSIVNVSSLAAKAGNLGQGNYAAAKAGVVALTKTTAREGASAGVRCNAVLPGFITTDMTQGLSSEAIGRLTEAILLGRPGTPAEVAQAVVFLASERASYITGTTLDVTGGKYL